MTADLDCWGLLGPPVRRQEQNQVCEEHDELGSGHLLSTMLGKIQMALLQWKSLRP